MKNKYSKVIVSFFSTIVLVIGLNFTACFGNENPVENEIINYVGANFGEVVSIVNLEEGSRWSVSFYSKDGDLKEIFVIIDPRTGSIVIDEVSA